MNYFRALEMMSAPLAHLDSWANALTGFGTSRDRTSQSVFVPDANLWPMQLAPLYAYSSTVRKIVALPVEEAWREGVEVKCDDPAWAERIHVRAHSIGLFKAFFDAQVWGRLFGGGLIWVGAGDGRPPNEPLDWARARSLDFLEVFDPRFAMPKGIHMLFPESWLLWGVEGGSAEVHHSRIIRFGGAHTDDLTRRGNRGWDLSIVQAIIGDIQAFDEAFHSAAIMLTDASQAVIKLKGLISAIAGKQTDLMKTRAMLLDMSRSVARALFLDKEEDFAKVPTQFSGTADVVMLFAKKLSAATGIPVAVLLGESPAGLQATGAIDIRIFYDKVAAERKRIVDPPLTMLLNLLAKSMGYRGDRVRIEWPSLWQETDAEQAATRLVVAQADKIYEEMGAVTPQQIWKDRWGKGEYSADNVFNPADAPTWAALPRNTTQDPETGKPAAAPPAIGDGTREDAGEDFKITKEAKGHRVTGTLPSGAAFGRTLSTKREAEHVVRFAQGDRSTAPEWYRQKIKENVKKYGTQGGPGYALNAAKSEARGYGLTPEHVQAHPDTGKPLEEIEHEKKAAAEHEASRKDYSAAHTASKEAFNATHPLQPSSDQGAKDYAAKLHDKAAAELDKHEQTPKVAAAKAAHEHAAAGIREGGNALYGAQRSAGIAKSTTDEIVRDEHGRFAPK